MRFAVFGATGSTGRQFVAQAVARGHDVTALSRSPDPIGEQARVDLVRGNVLDPEAVEETVTGADGVLCLLGKTANNPEDVVSRGTETICTAMELTDVDRLVVLTSMGLGSSLSTLPWYIRLANATVLHDLMADKARQEEIVMGSPLEWTIVRPGGLTDGPLTKNYVHGTDETLPARPIPRADVAHFILTVLETGSYRRETPSVTTDSAVTFRFLYDQFVGVARRTVLSQSPENR